MECTICTSKAHFQDPPRNAVCSTCCEGAKSILSIINKVENLQEEIQKTSNLSASQWSSKTLMDVSRRISGMFTKINGRLEESKFLGEMVSAFREQIHTDILVNPGRDETSIPAHKAILALRSEIFKNMLDSDKCKAPVSSTVTLAELNNEELECFLEFLYSGRVDKERLDKHVYAMLRAADKYEVPYLQKLCERHLLGSLNVTNVLEVLEASDFCSNQELKEIALNFIMKNTEDIVFSDKYDAFALKSPHLSVEITRAALRKLRMPQHKGKCSV